MDDSPPTIEAAYSCAREHLDALCDRVVDGCESIIIRREGGDVALTSAEEFESLIEFAHLFGSPANARRLLDAMESADRGEGVVMTVEELAASLGMERDAVHSA